MLRTFFIFFIFVILVCGAVIGLFFVDKFKIKNVAIEGNSILKEEEIRQQVETVMSAKILGIIPQDRFFSFPAEKVKSNLVSVFGRLDSVEIKKEGFSAVSVFVREREPVAILCVAESKDCFFIDETGFIFEEAPFFSSGVFVKFLDEHSTRPQIGQFLTEKETLERLFDFVDKAGYFFDITEIYLNDNGVYKFQATDGVQLILDEVDDWDLVFSNFETFLKDYKDVGYLDFEYIDLRFGNKVFYKVK